MFDFFRKKGNNPEESAKDGGSQNAAGATASGRTTRDALAEFTATPLPDAIDGLLFRVSMADPTDPTSSSGFDAYAARLLSEAEAPSLRAIAVEHPVELRRLNTTGLFWSIFDDSTISAGNRGTILRIESVLDRLALISKALEGDEGTAFVSATTEGACSELDWQVLRSIANDANDYLTAAERDNKLDTQYGTTGTRGGNWDLSTRLAAACEAMVLPFRLEYRFACDAGTGTIVASVSLPTPDVFPKSRFSRDAGPVDRLHRATPCRRGCLRPAPGGPHRRRGLRHFRRRDARRRERARGLHRRGQRAVSGVRAHPLHHGRHGENPQRRVLRAGH